jgi:hypothetical protein
MMSQLHCPLNHSYVVVKSEVFKAICQSDFLQKELAPVHLRTTTNDTATYTGFYIYGEKTYLEIFEEGNNPYALPNHFGVAFGTDTAGTHQKLTDALSKTNELPFAMRLMHRKMEGTEIPWFHYIDFDFDEVGAECNFWFMEYHSEYVRHKADWQETSAPPIDRKFYLDQTFRKETHANRKNFLLKNFSDIHLHLSMPASERFQKLLSVMSYKLEPKNSQTIGTGQENRFVIDPTHHNRLRKICFSLNQNIASPQTIHFGESCFLTLGPGSRGEWVFG